MRYKASGELGYRPVTLPLQHEGTFAAPKLRSSTSRLAAITSVSLTGARIALPLKIAM